MRRATLAHAELRAARHRPPALVHLLTAMLQAREAVGRRSWSHPQEPTGLGLVGRRPG
jgi:hypothetical protein